jgi:ankyrin repeat protein
MAAIAVAIVAHIYITNIFPEAKSMNNDYQLTQDYKTTGLSSIGPDINAYNSFGHTPVHVAIQAGAEDELKQLLDNPDCIPEKPSQNGHTTAWYLHVLIQRRKERGLYSLAPARSIKRLLEEAFQKRRFSEDPVIPAHLRITFRSNDTKLSDIRL